jgi:serine/threonine protein kinase
MVDDAISPVVLERTDGDGNQLLAQLLDQYLRSLEAGCPVSLDALAEKHPHLAKELVRLGEGIDVIHQATQCLSSGDLALGSQVSAPSATLGDFRLGREIGRGGMGVVYEAHQISLDRKVALKVLPFAAVWDTKQVARFQNEARAVAQLHHPNIVPVFSVGEEQGIHFYAMQLIAGRSLEMVLAGHHHGLAETPNGPAGPTVRETLDPGSGPAKAHSSLTNWSAGQPSALANFGSTGLDGSDGDLFRGVAKLGIEVAEALHHAHECGIIHRDVKPSNLLCDEQGKTWVADFGLARVENNPGVTLTGDVVGTLRYMSPEQAGGRQAEVDARTDVYGLGATLYEILTHQSPFPAEDRQQLLSDINTRDPVPLRMINPAIPRDLETVVLHALAKPREERYGSAKEFADDLARFLDGMPPHARRPTFFDVAQKWLFRNRAVATVAISAMAVLTLLSATGVILLARERAAKNAALALSDRNLKQAEANLQHAREVVDRFGIQLSELLREIPGAERLRQELLVETVSYYHELALQAADDPSLRDQFTEAHLKIASVTSAIGASQEAIDAYRRGQKLLEQQLTSAPGHEELLRRLGVVHNNLALVLADAQLLDDARTECLRAIEIYRNLQAHSPDDYDLGTQIAEIQGNLGTIASRQGDIPEARAAVEQAIATLIRLSGENPADPSAAHRLAILINNLSILERGDSLPDAERSAHKAVTLLEQIAPGRDAPADHRADLALAQANLAAIQARRGYVDNAAENLRAAIGIQRSLAERSPAVTRYRLDLINSLNSLALLDGQSGNSAAAEAGFEHASQVYSRLVADYPNDISYASGWAALLNNAALLLAKAEHHDKATRIFSTAEYIQERVAAVLPGSTPVKLSLSRIYYNHVESLAALGAWDEALATATKRRNLWHGQGEQLLGVAMEFLAIGALAPASLQPALRARVIATLQEAFAAGYDPPPEWLQNEPFCRVLAWPEFETLRASWPP